jgi:enamine deaminase RidA (YjgF/YER057c/UK114 family)
MVKVFGMVNVAPGFNQTPAVIDGCSDLLIEVFGDAGQHTRSAIGVAELPFDIAVEIELIAKLRPAGRLQP